MSKRNKAAERAARAAALKAERERQERLRRILTIGAVVAGIVIIIGGGFFIQSQRDSTGNDAAAPAGATAAYGVAVGDDGATHEVVIYEDFLCPVCGVLEAEAGEALTSAVDEGRARVEFRPVNFLEPLRRLLDGRRQRLRRRPRRRGAGGRQDLPRPGLRRPAGRGRRRLPGQRLVHRQGRRGRRDEEAVRTGIEEGAFEEWVDNATGAASEAGVNGTPTVLLDGEPVPGATIGEVAANLEAGLQ